MDSRFVRIKDLQPSDFPIIIRVPGTVLILGNQSMIASHQEFLYQVGCTEDSEVEASPKCTDSQEPDSG